MRRVYVAGAGETEYSRASGRTEQALAVEAIDRALADAGLRRADVEGLVCFAQDTTLPSQMAERMGLDPLRWSSTDSGGGSAACSMLGHAQVAIASGRADVVVAYRSFNGRSGRRFGQPPPGSVMDAGVAGLASGSAPIGGEFSGPYGLLFPVQAFAIWASAYRDGHGMGDEDLIAGMEAVAVRQRHAAHDNPRAVLRDRPLGPSDYRSSPPLSDPLRLADLCIEVDGAAALVLAAERKLQEPAVRLAGALQSIGGGYEDLFLRRTPLPPRVPPSTIPQWLESLGTGAQELDLICTYDACTFNVLVDVEMIGLCAEGDGWRWVQQATIPFNTSGGQLSEGYLQGVNAAVEAFRRVRAGARRALVTGAACASAVLLVAP